MWFRKRRQESSEASQALHSLTLRVGQLEELLAALEDKHERLRGRFYALRGAQANDAPHQVLSKAELLAKFVPKRS